MPRLTPKQEKFCIVYRETGNASEAYRQAYDASRMKPNSVHRKAFEVIENGNVAARLKEMSESTLKRHDDRIDKLIAELEEARQLALEREILQIGAAVSATMGKAKILGFDKQVVESTVNVNGRLTAEYKIAES